MRVPQASAHHSARSRIAFYVARRLHIAAYLSFAKDLRTCGIEVRQAGRAWEDSEDDVQIALADRDAADAALDLAAQTARSSLAGRSAHAVDEEPYTLIFEQGVGYYTAAPLGEEEARYGELIERLAANLPASDKVRSDTTKAVKAGLTAFRDASKALAKATTAKSLLATKLAHVTHKWERQMDKTYGQLISDLGKPAAEQFFPKVRSSQSAHEDPAPSVPAEESKKPSE